MKKTRTTLKLRRQTLRQLDTVQLAEPRGGAQAASGTYYPTQICAHMNPQVHPVQEPTANGLYYPCGLP